jgi:single-strand DNA-binding protein
MAANFNKVMLMGNLTRDPELRYLPSNMPVVEVGLAVNNKYRTKDGEDREETLFIDCTAFGRQAEVLNQYMSKGRPIFIEGRLKLDTWDDRQSGQKRSKHKVTIDNFQMLGGRDDAGQGGGGGGGGGYARRGNNDDQGGGYGDGRGQSRQAPSRPPQRDEQPAPEKPFDDADQQFGDDDIPF